MGQLGYDWILSLNTDIPSRTRKEYREDNKNILNTKVQQRRANCNTKIECDCGGLYKWTIIIKHFILKLKDIKNIYYQIPSDPSYSLFFTQIMFKMVIS